MKVGVIGAGHAGVAAAQAAAKKNSKVTLFSNERFLPYYRPRVPAVAFGQAGKEEALMHPKEWYQKNNIDLKLDTEITKVTPECKVTDSIGKNYFFDKIIFTYGARPIIPPFAKTVNPDKLVSLWSMENALKINSKTGSAKNIVIIGGGVIGLEAAIRGVDAGFNVKVIEKAETLLIRNLNPKMSNALEQYLRNRQVEVLTGISVEKINESGDKLILETDTSETVETELVIMSIGAGMNPALAENAGIECSRKVKVNEFLKSSNNKFFAAGDIAEVNEISAPCSAMRAAKQGKTAGINSIITDTAFNTFTESPITLQVKYNDFSLFAVGNPDSNAREIVLEENEDENILRLINIDNENIVVGVQMLGSNKDFKKFEKLYLQKDKFE
ncbi:MAG: FAD-dependent oxidoreductase [Victivallales bacterium]|nr:FAD-dependent oxidoreductase [Victivallales bacterium]